MISVTLKFLNGDLLQIHHKPSRGFDDFVRTIYRSCDFIPYGCLRLTRLPDGDDDDLVEDDVAQLMRLSDIYSSDEVTEVYDGDILMACVDTTLVTPCIFQEGFIALPSRTHRNFEHICRKYTIVFRSHDDDDLFHSQITFVHDTDHNTFALYDTFVAPTQQQFADAHRMHRNGLYKSGPSTVWFNTLGECISASTERFPHDSSIIQAIQDDFNNTDWSLHEYDQYDDPYFSDSSIEYDDPQFDHSDYGDDY